METIRYNVLAAYVGPEIASGNYFSGDIQQLHRVQSTNYQIEIQREETRALGTSITNEGIIQSPYVNLSIDYLGTDGGNERKIGLVVDGLHGALLDLNSGERDYFLLVSGQPNMVMAVGNARVMNYGVRGQVGNILSASIGVRGFNIKVDEGDSGNFIPKVNLKGIENTTWTYQIPPISKGIQTREVGYIPTNTVVVPRSIMVDFANSKALGLDFSGKGFQIQSFSLNLGLPRTEMFRIGDKYPINRDLQLPLEISLSVEGLVTKFQRDSIQNYLCRDSYDLNVDIKTTNCHELNEFWEEETPLISKLKYGFKGLKLKNVSFNNAIGDRQNASIEWSVNLGSLTDFQKNFFISGDFGRYSFYPSFFQDVVGSEMITGFGLETVIQTADYKRYKTDITYPDFSLGFSGQFDVHYCDAVSSVNYYRGDLGVRELSGDFGQFISESKSNFRADSYSTYNDGNGNPNYIQNLSGFKVSANNYFYIKSDSVTSDDVQLSFVDLPNYIQGSFSYPIANLSPEQPYFFNRFNLNLLDPSIPSGSFFSFKIVAASKKIKRLYNIITEVN